MLRLLLMVSKQTIRSRSKRKKKVRLQEGGRQQEEDWAATCIAADPHGSHEAKAATLL